MVQAKNLIPGRRRERQKLLRAHRGLLAEVARATGCTLTTVSQVYYGRCQSARIHARIEAVLRRRLAEVVA